MSFRNGRKESPANRILPEFNLISEKDKNSKNGLNSDLNPDSDNFINFSVNKNAPKGGGMPNGLDPDPADIKNVTINGIKMIRLRDNSAEAVYVTEKNRMGFVIQRFSNTDKSVKVNFDKILQTFTFLN